MSALDLRHLSPTVPRFRRVRRFTFRLRGRHLFALDLLTTLLAIVLAMALRFDGLSGFEAMAPFMPVMLLPLVVRPFTNIGFGLYRRLWRYASVADLFQIAMGVLAGSIVAVAVFYSIFVPLGVPGTAGFPRSFWVIEGILSLAFFGGSRFLIRAHGEWRSIADDVPGRNRVPALLFGAGRAGAMIARSAQREPRAGVQPVGFLDDDPTRKGQSIAGVPVIGDLSALPRAIATTGAKMLLITMPRASGEAIRGVMDAGVAAGLEVRTIPPFHELIEGTIDAFRVRPVHVEDLLGRTVSKEHAAGVQGLIRDRVVLITGAGGSIGSELARQVHALGPKEIVLVDRAESPLYTIERELEVRGLQGRGSGTVTTFLGNVASRGVMIPLVRSVSPDVIFHAAAYKHVPMMESYPSEGVQVNIGGTRTMLDAAVAASVPRFVLVSTDKAVEPSSVMGATKRVAEALVAARARETGLAYVSVRFGNVLGSAGSVVPIFEHQLEHGEPLTVTHPEMTRYFMTIAEATWLILDSASIGKPGDLFVLDMGEPVRIMDLARDLIRLSGRPEDRVSIEITGLRPGEKLHEQLFYDAEQINSTEVPKVLRAVGDPIPEDIDARAQRILAAAGGDQDEILRTELFELIHTIARPGELQRADVQPVAIPVGDDGDARQGGHGATNGHGSSNGHEATNGGISIPLMRPSAPSDREPAVPSSVS